jgi:hypothetical protein
MKKGDIISRSINFPIGTIVYGNCSSVETADSFMKNVFAKEYKILPTYELVIDEFNPLAKAVSLTSPVIFNEEARVNWVIDDEVAITSKNGSCRIFSLKEEKDWIVKIESAPSYQSSVVELSDEELKDSIEALKNKRIHSEPKARKSVREPVQKLPPPDAIAKALEAITDPIKREDMKRKLGLV